ncbi:MAG: M23 family metallopeptidase [Burkholderiaceae bacterium]|jgi:murein DD-endopeptidase MepM/ murein hydrolase activator NlpD
MQLMWLADPTGQLKSISITGRHILYVALGVSATMLLLGFALNWVGLRIAVEFNPELARSLGGITSLAEQERTEAAYRKNIEQLQISINETRQDLKNLEVLKNHFMALATPMSLKDKIPQLQDSKGGPYVLPSTPSQVVGKFFQQPLRVELAYAAEQLKAVKNSLQSQQLNWTQHLEWLEALPLGLPIQSDFRLTSGFGNRNDPFTGHLAMHEGIDFSADVGTAVVAAAPGLVMRSEWDPTFGNVVEIKHAENFMTRYAHLNKRLVSHNSHVQGGSRIGEVGSTGRSTGPHLHYEIFHNGKVINPAKVLPLKGL